MDQKTQCHSNSIGQQVVHIEAPEREQPLYRFGQQSDADGEQPQYDKRTPDKPSEKIYTWQIHRGVQKMVRTQPEQIVVQRRHAVKRQPHQQRKCHKIPNSAIFACQNVPKHIGITAKSIIYCNQPDFFTGKPHKTVNKSILAHEKQKNVVMFKKADMKKHYKVILVTGASSGIGYETAMRLARQGHRVYAAARRMERMEPLRAEGIVPIRMDVTDNRSMSEVVKKILEAEGRIDVLVNNAGYGYFGAIENVSSEEAHRQLEVNVFGLAELCRMVLPAMRKQGSGRIINTSSIAGKIVLPFGGWYHVSKFAVEALGDALRMEMKPYGIDVVLIEPGGIRTDWGIIAARHLADSSIGTVYETDALHEAAVLEMAYTGRYLSSPKVVTRAISRAVNSRRPRTRYRIGRFAHLGVFLHNIIPTRWWDAMMRGLAYQKNN